MKPAALADGQLRTLASLTVELVTPQLGGGAEPMNIDAAHWLRPSAVRGGLRKWWRAAYGARSSPELMRQREALIFGSASETGSGVSGCGAIGITVTASSASVDQTPFAPQEGDALNITYFSASRELQKRDVYLLSPVAAGPSATIRLTWTHTIEVKEHAAVAGEIRDALALWLLFGGSGSRTRRGAGKLVWKVKHEAAASGIPVNAADLKVLLQRTVQTSGHRSEFLNLTDSQIFAWKAERTPELAHRKLMGVWRAFRQQRSAPPDWKGAKGWGRTSWAEADGIRAVFNRDARDTKHARHQRTTKFEAVRAHLGLPLIFRFKQPGDPGGGREPIEFERAVANKPRDRFASPVILGMARLAEEQDGEFVALALVTHSTLRDKVRPRGTNAIFEVGPEDVIFGKLVKHFTAKKAERII